MRNSVWNFVLHISVSCFLVPSCVSLMEVKSEEITGLERRIQVIKSLTSDANETLEEWGTHAHKSLPWKSTQLSIPVLRIASFQFTPDGKHIVIGEVDTGKIFFWNPIEDKLSPNPVVLPKKPSSSFLVFSRSTRHYIASSTSKPGFYSVYDGENDKPLFDLPPTGDFGGYDFSPNGKMIVGTNTVSFSIFQLTDGSFIRFHLPRLSVDCVRFASNRELIARTLVGTDQNTVSLAAWDLMELTKAGDHNGLPRNSVENWRVYPFLAAGVVASTGALHAKGPLMGVSQLFPGRVNYEPKSLVSITGSGFYSFELSKNRTLIYQKKTVGRFLGVSTKFEPLQITNWKKDTLILKLSPGETRDCVYKLSEEHKVVAAGDEFGEIHLYDFPSGQKKYSQAITKERFLHVDISVDGSILGAATLNKVYLWDLKTLLGR